MTEEKRRKRNDIILIVIIIAVILGFLLLRLVLGNREPEIVKIKVDGNVTGTYSLNKDRIIEINEGSNILVIKDKKVYMKEASCPDQICVKHKPIDSNLESIICLPNKVVVEVTAAKDSEIDSITN